jgi:uncharacterized membrane protein YkoI
MFLSAALAAILFAGCETSREARRDDGGKVEAKAAASKEAAGENEADLALDAVPEKVLEAARNAVPGITFTSAETEIERGVRIYDLNGTADGVAYEIEVDADGNVTEIEKGGDDGDGADDDED